jgi:hypothetical protein
MAGKKRVYTSDIAIMVANEGFKVAAAKYDITPLRARDVIEAMKTAGVETDKIPKELVDLAALVKAFGHRRKPPVAGEERKHKATVGGRVSAYGPAIGIKAGGDANVRYETDRIVITKGGRKAKTSS